jgi:hypothetical protein
VTAILDSKLRVTVKTKTFKLGDVVQIEEQGPDMVVLKRMKPADTPNPKLVRIKGELFSKGGGSLTNDEVRRLIEDEP